MIKPLTNTCILKPCYNFIWNASLAITFFFLDCDISSTLDHTNCLISQVRPLYFILVPVTISGKSGEAIAAAIATPIVVVAIVIITIAFYYRCVIENLIRGCQGTKKSVLK